MRPNYSTYPDTTRGFTAWVLGAVILVVLLMSLPGIGSFFSQDDFAGMNVHASSMAEFKRFFAPDPQGLRGWYRPVSFDLKFWVMHRLFGFNPIPHHLLPILLHCLNIILCYRFLHMLTGRTDVPLLSATLYGLCGAHQVSLNWISAGVEPITALFYLLGLIAFLKWRDRPSIIGGVATCLLFIIMLLCKETAITFPVVLLLISIIFPGGSSGKHKGTWVYITLFIILVGYLIFWFSAQYQPGLGSQSGYGLTLNPAKLLLNFFAYLVQVFIGNAIIYSTMGSITANPREYVTSLMHSTAGYILGIAGLVVLGGFLFWLKKRVGGFTSFQKSYIVFGLCWFVICLIPVLPFPGHNTAYYVNIAMIGFSSCLAAIALGIRETARSREKAAIAGWVLLGFYILNFSVNGYIGATSSQIARRGEVAREALVEMKSMHLSFEPGTLLFIIDIDEESRITLNDGLIYKSYYGPELRWVFTIKEGQKITWSYLEVHGWDEGGQRIFYSYDGHQFIERDETYFLNRYPPDR